MPPQPLLSLGPAEQQCMESYMTLPPPLTQSQSMAEDHLAAPTATQTRDEGQVEKTMFFQSDFSSHRDDSALVMQLLEATLAEVLTDEQLTLAMDSQEANSKLGPKPKLQHAIQLRKHLYWALGTCAVLATVLGLYLSMGLCDGALNVTSIPMTQVKLFLDNILVVRHMPYTQTNVPVGKHRLVACPNGFRDKAYHFELVLGVPADICIELEHDQTLVMPSEAKLEVTSDLQMASLCMGGLPQGPSPVTLQHPDTAHPIVLEISKPSFEMQSITVNFSSQEQQKTVHMQLTPTSSQAACPSTMGQGPLQPATLMVMLHPSGSAMFISSVQQGIMPTTLMHLDSQAPYNLEITHNGFRLSKLMANMAGQTQVNVVTTLTALRTLWCHADCAGTGAKLGVMALEVSDC